MIELGRDTGSLCTGDNGSGQDLLAAVQILRMGGTGVIGFAINFASRDGKVGCCVRIAQCTGELSFSTQCSAKRHTGITSQSEKLSDICIRNLQICGEGGTVPCFPFAQAQGSAARHLQRAPCNAGIAYTQQPACGLKITRQRIDPFLLPDDSAGGCVTLNARIAERSGYRTFE